MTNPLSHTQSMNWGTMATGATVLLGLALGSYIAYKRLRNGSPSNQPYEEWTKDELYERAREEDISGRSNMNKDELIEALRDA